MAAESIAAVEVPVLSADQVVAAPSAGRWAAEWRGDPLAAPPCAGRWVVALRSAQAGVLLCADRSVVAPRSAQAGVPQSEDQQVVASLLAREAMLPCGGLRVTSPLVQADRIRTSIVVRTFMVGPIPIMAGALLRQVSWQGPLLALRQQPHTTTRTTRNPIIHLTAGRLTRRPTPPTVRIRIRTAAMCKARQAMALLAALVAATFDAKAQEADIAAGRSFAREACKACHAVEPSRLPRRFEIGPAFRDIANAPGMTTTALTAFLTTSHPKMPNLILTPKEIADVTAYILSLRHHR